MVDTIVACCLSGKPNRFHPQHDPTKRAYYEKWAYSILQAGLNGVVLHNGLDESERVACIEFVDVEMPTDYLVLDDCWFLFLDWLRENEVSKAILTDIADVVFHYDPFPLIVDDRLYVCREERPNIVHTYHMEQFQRFYGKMLYPYERAFNSGIVGGSKATVLPFVESLTAEIDRIGGGEQVAMNHVIHRDGWETVWGRPWHSRFGGYRRDRCAISHK